MNAPLTAGLPAVRCFARELCLAVAHRWQPERIFVVLTLTAYFDESGTHDGSTATVMAGAMANAYQWERFESAFSSLKKKHGFQIFHAKKFKKRTGDFKGWNPLRQLGLMADLAEIADGAFPNASPSAWTTPTMRRITKAATSPGGFGSKANTGFASRTA